MRHFCARRARCAEYEPNSEDYSSVRFDAPREIMLDCKGDFGGLNGRKKRCRACGVILAKHAVRRRNRAAFCERGMKWLIFRM